jgi:hypothetical protein
VASLGLTAPEISAWALLGARDLPDAARRAEAKAVM